MKATVYKSTGSWYVVKSDPDSYREGVTYNARIKGKFKIDDITSTNPIAVGDHVEIEMENEGEGSVVINKILDRKNYITRQSPHNKHQHHIVAANLDQSLLFATLKDPKTSQGFIDRFLVTSEAYHLPSIIVFNKADLHKKKEEQKLDELKNIYEAIGYKVMAMSIEKNTGVEEVKALLKDKITLLTGHSGVGKSSFINFIFPELKLKTQDVSGWSGKGLHTTTFAEMFDLAFCPKDSFGGGKVIDTPGLREFALMDISKQELSHYFPEMLSLINDCQFNNCMHINEPGCAVKEAVNIGSIATDRYVSYLTLLEGIEKKTW
ncbi:MAG TPA: ribosome small subunit-dependent GTPase A [Chitinophagaceae bacterium]|nr:ribosome small subunit-dependent GTPase A [Chitinophagaceae bacterium]